MAEEQEAPAILPMSDIFASISGVRIKDTEPPSLEFKVTIPLSRLDTNRDLIHVATARQFGGANVTLRLVQQPLPEAPPPMDGEIPTDPFPQWEKLFEAADMPMCNCPDEGDPARTRYPTSVFITTAEGTKVEIAHVDPCKLPTVTISTMDFAETEDFNRAIVKARGLKPVPLPDEPEPEPDDEVDA